jgi:hypothetical protein
MTQQLLAIAAELEDRHKSLEGTAANLWRSPRENNTVRRHTSIYWTDCRESCRTKSIRDFGSPGTVLNEGVGHSIVKYRMLYKQRFVPVIDCACPICVYATRTHVGKTQVGEEMDLAIGRCHFLTLLTRKFTRFWRTDFSLTTLEHLPSDWTDN